MPLSAFYNCRCSYLLDTEAAPSQLMQSTSSGDIHHRRATRHQALFCRNVHLAFTTRLPTNTLLAPFAFSTSPPAQSRIRNPSCGDSCSSKRYTYGTGLLHGCPVQPNRCYIDYSTQTQYLNDTSISLIYYMLMLTSIYQSCRFGFISYLFFSVFDWLLTPKLTQC